MITGSGRRYRSRRRLTYAVAALGLLMAGGLGSLYLYAGVYGLNVLFRHGGTWWIPVQADSSRLSPSMRLALGAAPVATPGDVQWTAVAPGFETADLAAMVDGHDVDHVLLARIEPSLFRFEVQTAYAGNVGLDQWMTRLRPALLVNGSYSGRDGTPATPVISNQIQLGPRTYDATAGAFVSSSAFTGVRDFSHSDWVAVFHGAHDAMVSFPLLLANRSFVGQDGDGRIIISTTKDAFFTLDRLARFLLAAPLGLTVALNLDGGPVASQAIALDGYQRRTYGRWEAQVEGSRVQLLVWPYGTVALPVVLAVFPK